VNSLSKPSLTDCWSRCSGLPSKFMQGCESWVQETGSESLGASAGLACVSGLCKLKLEQVLEQVLDLKLELPAA
jgi:hypothetical protein